MNRGETIEITTTIKEIITMVVVTTITEKTRTEKITILIAAETAEIIMTTTLQYQKILMIFLMKLM